MCSENLLILLIKANATGMARLIVAVIAVPLGGGWFLGSRILRWPMSCIETLSSCLYEASALQDQSVKMR